MTRDSENARSGAMRRLVPTLVLIAALASCGGKRLPFDVQTDAGCLLYTPTFEGHCTVAPCDAGANSDAGPNLANTAVVDCPN